MKKREIWNVFFDPIIGSEQGGNRPAVIISGNNLNNNLDVIWVCPISSSIHKFEGNPILKPNSENGLKVESEIMVFHLRSVSKKRLKKRIGSISTEQMNQISVTINDIIEL